MIKFNKLIDSFNIDKTKKLIVAVSAGVDSMVLTNLLLTNNYDIVIVHFNHNTRENNIKEEKLVKDFALKNNILNYVFNLNVTGSNFHEEARKLRYKHLKEIATKYNTPYIVTAHHLDDLAETILLKMIRGSNLYGYAGIHPIYSNNGFIYLKPLIEVSKLEIINYSKENNISYLEDESNYLDHYSRNRIRHTVIPILKQENSNFLNKILEYHETLKSSFHFIRNITKNIVTNNKFKVSDYIAQEKIVRDDILSYILENNLLNISKNLLEDLNNLISSSKPNLTYNLENNYLFVKSYNECFITIKNDVSPFTITLNEDVTILPNMKKITFSNNTFDNNKKGIKICYNNLELPLIARTRLNGDYVTYNYGRKKVKDLFIDLKIPKYKRDELVIITDSNNTILYIEDVYINKTLGEDNCLSLEILKLGEDFNG